MTRLRSILFNILVGIPAGALIVMGMFLFTALLGKIIPLCTCSMWIMLWFSALLVGFIARLLRPYHGMGSALAAGIVAALILLVLRLTTPGTEGNLAYGPVGMLSAIALSLLGSWMGERKPKAQETA